MGFCSDIVFGSYVCRSMCRKSTVCRCVCRSIISDRIICAFHSRGLKKKQIPKDLAWIEDQLYQISALSITRSEQSRKNRQGVAPPSPTLGRGGLKLYACQLLQLFVVVFFSREWRNMTSLWRHCWLTNQDIRKQKLVRMCKLIWKSVLKVVLW